MPSPYDEFQQPAAVADPYAEFAVPASTDWVEASKAKLEALDKRLGEAAAQKPVVDPGGVGALGHGLQSGLTLGWQPKIEAATTAGLGQVANALGGNEGSFSDIYQRELAKNLATGKELQEAHPKTHFAADLVGGTPAYATAANPILVSALGGGARAAGESENVAGEKGTNLRGLAETAGGAGAGAATAYLLPKVFGRLSNRYGKKADEAATQAVTFGTQTARDKFNQALAPVRAMSPGGEMAPGEVATILKKAGAVGGLRGQRGTLKGIQEAKQALGEEFGGIISAADKAHPGVPLSSVESHLSEAVAENQANDHMGKVVENINGRLGRLSKGDTVPHAALQDALSEMNRTASKIYKKPPHTWSEHDAAFVAGYRALRGAQAEGLEAATGVNANDVRKYMAMTYGLEPIAEKAVNRFEGNDKVGLLGELKKSQGMGSIGQGVLAIATGHPGVAAPLVLKGALDVARGHFGKASSPLRNNLSTSINLALQKPLNQLSQSELAQLIVARLAYGTGAGGGGSLYDRLMPGTPEPDETQPPPLVAKKGK